MEAAAAFQAAMAVFSAIAFVLMLMPVVCIDERRYSASVPCDDGFLSSIGKVVKDRNFLIFTLSDFAYWVSLYFINNGLMYYLTVLLGLPKETYSALFIVMFLASFACYLPVATVARKVGRRRLLIAAFLLFALLFAFCSLFGTLPFPPMVQGTIAAILAALPLAIFGILPNAMIADMAEAYSIETGMHKAGVFFGFRTFMSKMGQSVGAVILPSILMIGAEGSAVGESGTRMTTYFALGFCAIGVALLLAYDEKKTITSLAKRNETK